MASPERRCVPININLTPTALRCLRVMTTSQRHIGLFLSELIMNEVARRETRAAERERFAAVLSDPTNAA
jgi:hypothetical protein